MATNNAINKIITATPTALAVPIWDSNLNLSANSHINGFATTVRAISTNVTLTVASALTQFFTGDASFGTDNIIMPVTSTLVAGQAYTIVNTSTAYALTVQSSGANTIISVPAGYTAYVICVLNSGTTAASWYAALQAPSAPTFGITSGSWTPTISAQTPGTLSVSYSTQSGSWIRIANSGTNFCIMKCRMTATPTWGTASGDVYITGLPFTASGGGEGAVFSQSASVWTWSTSRTQLNLSMFQSPIAIKISKQISAQNSANMQVSDITTASSQIFNFQMTYLV